MVAPVAGTTVKSSSTGLAVLTHDPILDWGEWKQGNAVGALALTELFGEFKPGDKLTFLRESESGDTFPETATAVAGSPSIEHRQWFLVEDGGYPPDLEPLIGVFRSPLWLRRNRYLEESARQPEAEETPRTARQIAPLRRPPAGRLRVEAFADALGGTSRRAFASEGLTPRTFDPGRSGADFAATGKDRELVFPGLLRQQLETIFPDWFVKSLANDRKELLEQAAAFALPMLGRVLDELSETVAKQIDPETRSRLSKTEIDHRQLEILVRGLLRQIVQILAGSEVAVATKVAQALLNPVPGSPGQLVDRLTNAILWALGYDTTTGHTAVLLTMGRDAFRGRLTYDPSRTIKLQATLPTRLLDTASATHERVLREIASAGWRGELRTNPGWTTLGKRVSVHSQGGCPMGKPGKSVTSADGQVHGREGLYVMDAAAFPASVGVNPSATIAAIAEYKIERFIRKTKESWSAPDHDPARQWMNKHGRDLLDPLNSGSIQTRRAPSPDVNVIGMSFIEAMHGFSATVPEASRISFWNLEKFPDHVRTFVEAESAGITTRCPIQIHLRVNVEDLARLIAQERTLEPAKLKLSGCGAFGLSEDDPGFQIDEGSFLQMFVRPGAANSPKFFRYHLRYAVDGKPHILNGLKVLCNAPGFDSWHDTSTVYFESTGPGGWQRGILRVSLETFLREQLPSMEITGTSDAARKSWALAAFYKYFAGELADVYLERADAVRDAFFKLVTGIHV